MRELAVGADVEAERGRLGDPLALDGRVRAEDDRLADRAGGDPVADALQPEQCLASAGRQGHPRPPAARRPGTGQRVQRLALVDAQLHAGWGNPGVDRHPQNTLSTTAWETRMARITSLTISSVAPGG